MKIINFDEMWGSKVGYPHYVSTYHNDPIWPPGAELGAPKLLTPFLLSKIKNGPVLPMWALGEPILGGPGNYPRPFPNHNKKSLVYPSPQAQGAKPHVFRPIFGPELSRVLT